MRPGDDLTKPTDIPPDRVGLFLRQYCAREHLTLKEVSVRAGYTQSYLSKVVRGERRLSLSVLERLADVLNLTESEHAALRTAAGYVAPNNAAPDTTRDQINHTHPSTSTPTPTPVYGYHARPLASATMALPTLVRREDDHSNGPTGEPTRSRAPFAAGEHIDGFFTRLVEDPAWLAMPDAQREIGTLARHLGECEHCQVFLETLLRSLAARATPQSERETASLQLLERLRSVNERTRVRKQLSAYALRGYALGEHAARVAFPETSAHLKTCAMCRREVEERQQALRRQMDALAAPQLTIAQPPVDSEERSENDRKLSRGVEHLARTRIKARKGHQIAGPALIIGVGAEADEVSAALGQDVLELCADDRKRIALVSFSLGHAEPTAAWRGRQREQQERRLAGEGPWMAEMQLGSLAFSTPARSNTPALDTLTRAQVLTHTLGEALHALAPRTGAENVPLPVLLLAPSMESERVQFLAETAATIRQVARQQDITPHITVMCVPSNAGGAPHHGERVARRERRATNGKEADHSPGQHDGGVTSATPAESFDTIWLVGMDGVPRRALASALSRQLRVWLGGWMGSDTMGRPYSPARLAGQRQETPRAYAGLAAEVVFPLEDTALSFALCSAAAVLPELAAREGLERHDAKASQMQLASMAETVLDDWNEQVSQVPDRRHLFDTPGSRKGISVQPALKRLYLWATLGTTPGAETEGRANIEAVVAAHMDACLEALRVARRDAAQGTASDDERRDAREDEIRWLALTLVGYFRWFYIEKLGALDLCELLLRSGQAATMDECATLLSRQAKALQRWLESVTPHMPTANTDNLYNNGHAPASTLSVSLHGQPQTIWREMAESLCTGLSQAWGSEVALTVDSTLADPHRLRLWFARPSSDLAEQDDLVATLIEACGKAEQDRPEDFAPAPDQREAPRQGKKPAPDQRNVPAPGKKRRAKAVNGAVVY